jgi:hypothetical protein
VKILLPDKAMPIAGVLIAKELRKLTEQLN